MGLVYHEDGQKMTDINFVPEDYVQNSESRRTNLIYLVLFMVVMAGLGGSFMTIKIRQKMCAGEENKVNEKMTQVQEALSLQEKRKAMLKTALTTAELIEPVPRSVLLALLTNDLPAGVSFVQLNLVQEKKKQVRSNSRSIASKYHTAKTKKNAAIQPQVSPEKLLQTNIEITGVAPSDLQVASYIEKLSSSFLLHNVALVESKEYEFEDTTFRKFRLTAMVKADARITEQDVASLHVGGELMSEKNEIN